MIRREVASARLYQTAVAIRKFIGWRSKARKSIRLREHAEELEEQCRLKNEQNDLRKTIGALSLSPNTGRALSVPDVAEQVEEESHATGSRYNTGASVARLSFERRHKLRVPWNSVNLANCGQTPCFFICALCAYRYA